MAATAMASLNVLALNPRARASPRGATRVVAPRVLARAPGVLRAAVAARATHKFAKYQGLGNDFVMIDERDGPVGAPSITGEQAAKMCDRNFGIGADGVIVAMPKGSAEYPGRVVEEEDYAMRMFNSDGTEPEMCGNGIRCLANFVAAIDDADPRAYKVGTLAGLIQPECKPDGQVAVDMGVPTLTPADVPTKLAATEDGAAVKSQMTVDGATWLATAVSMGNPHCVTFGRKKGDEKGLAVDDMDLAAIGPSFESHETFPARTNTEFVEVVRRDYVKMRVWERGAGATLACGTGACATVVAGVLEGRTDRKCTVELPGGPLEIEWRESDSRVIMTGPAELVFYGEIDA